MGESIKGIAAQSGSNVDCSTSYPVTYVPFTAAGGWERGFDWLLVNDNQTRTAAEGTIDDQRALERERATAR
jgi:hypothetical protein